MESSTPILSTKERPADSSLCFHDVTSTSSHLNMHEQGKTSWSYPRELSESEYQYILHTYLFICVSAHLYG